MHVINYDLPSTMHGGIQEYTHRIGRTARIGNQGLATSFYNERDEDLAQDLVNILIECEQSVPEFLSHLVPESDTKVQFDDDTDDEDAAEAGKGLDGVDSSWGAGEPEAAAAGPGDAPTGSGWATNESDVPATGWGAHPEPVAEQGWKSDLDCW